MSGTRFNLVYLWQQRIDLARNDILRLVSLTRSENRKEYYKMLPFDFFTNELTAAMLAYIRPEQEQANSNS